MDMVIPMEPVYAETIDDSGDYTFQIKWDGIRLLADKSRSGIVLYTRRGRVRTQLYPELVAELQGMQAGDFLLDGELIALNSQGLPDFHRIIKRDRSRNYRRDIAIGYMVFDCLRMRGKNLCSDALETRQGELAHLVEGIPPGVTSLCSNYDDGARLFAHMDALGMEGVVGKRKGSPYLVGRKTDVWQKTKCWREIELRAIAINFRDSRPSSLVAAKQVDGQWVNVGNVATGLTDDHWRRVLSDVEAVPAGNRTVPLDPGYHLRVRFLEWTQDGRLRSPAILQFSEI